MEKEKKRKRKKKEKEREEQHVKKSINKIKMKNKQYQRPHQDSRHYINQKQPNFQKKITEDSKKLETCVRKEEINYLKNI